VSAAEQSGKVTIRRDHPDDAQQRQVVARVDNGVEATLMFGEQITIDVPAGAHELRANNTLVWKTVPFTLAAGEHVEFQLINRAGKFAMTMLGILGVAPLRLTIVQRTRVDG
jgi:hypothetical protein